MAGKNISVAISKPPTSKEQPVAQMKDSVTRDVHVKETNLPKASPRFVINVPITNALVSSEEVGHTSCDDVTSSTDKNGVFSLFTLAAAISLILLAND